VKRYGSLCVLVALACTAPDFMTNGTASRRGPPRIVRVLGTPPGLLVGDGGTEEAPDGRDTIDPGPTSSLDAGTAETDAGPIDPVDPVDPADPVDPGPSRAAPMFGVTVTNPWAATESSALNDTLASFESPTARVVFDSGVDRVLHTYDLDASSYQASVAAIGANARVMGELLDSFFFPRYTVDQFRARACEYRASLGHLVDIWEIGNEINGEWLGAGVEAKLTAGIQVFRASPSEFAAMCPGYSVRADERPFELALTLYYNGEHNGGVATFENCWANPEHAMLRWTASRMTPEMASVDYMFVSFYEDDCHGSQPNWQRVFDGLGAIVPTAQLGIGECGTRNEADKVRYVERYYGGMDSAAPAYSNMRVDHPRFVGGYFWWYLSDDLDQPAVLDALRASQSLPFWSR
jgi:hypothetical protein